MRRLGTFVGVLLLSFVFSLAFENSLFSQEKVQVHLKTLLIGIESYDLGSLDFVKNDLRELSAIFQLRYGANSQAIIDYPPGYDVNSTAADRYRKPILESIETWTKGLEKGDTAILYLSGHGVSDSNGKLYLPMTNYDGKDFENTAIPLSLIRSLFEASEASAKLIILDTCYSGNDKGLAVVGSGDMAQEFLPTQEVATLASSRPDQKSWIWNKMKHSLFTYWVIESFKGNADLNGDQKIEIDELLQYLDTQVSWISEDKKNGMETQNPLLLHEEAIAKTLNLSMMAVKTADVIENVATNIDLALELKEAKELKETKKTSDMVMIPEFMTGDGENVENQYGSLPRTLATQLENELVALTERRSESYGILSANATQEVLEKNGITPKDLATSKTKSLEYDEVSIRYIISGRVSFISNNGLQLEVNLYDTKTKRKMTTARGIAMMTANELAAAGASFALPEKPKTEEAEAEKSKPEESPEQKPEEYIMVADLGLVNPQDQENLEQVQEAIAQPHPMLDSSLPISVKFEVRAENEKKYTPREGKVIDNVYYLPLKKGEEYAIRMSNNSNNEYFVRVLVDGLNTLPERKKTGNSSEQGKYVIAPCVELENARPYVLFSQKQTLIKGFLNENNQVTGDAEFLCFKYVDADQSLAARKNYTKQLGLITIACYQGAPQETQKQSKRRGGTDTGKKEKVKLETYKGDNIPVKEPTAVYNIRYVSQEKFDELVKASQEKDQR